jgi:hypothetical protein
MVKEGFKLFASLKIKANEILIRKDVGMEKQLG